MSRLLRILTPLLLLGLCACGDGRDVILDSGPRLLSVGPDSATVAWTTSEPADSFIEWFTDEPAGSIRVEAKEAAHTIRITGLVPDTAYRYRVCSGPVASPIHAFRTAPAELRPFTFAACGGTDDPESLERLGEAVAASDAAFVCRVGAGPAASALEASRPALAPDEQSWRSFTYLNVESFVIDAMALRRDDTQWRWLETQFALSKAEWKVVVCRPSPLDDRVRAVLLPLLLDGGVDLVVAGAEKPERPQAIGSGKDPEKNAVTILTLGQAPGQVVLVSVDRETLVLRAADRDGKEADVRTLRKERGARQVPDAQSIEMVDVPPLFQPADGFDMGSVGKDLVTKRFDVAIANPYSKAMEAEFRWVVHLNTSWSLDPPLLKIAVPPGSRRTYSFTASVVAPDVEPAPTATFMCGEKSLSIERSPFRFTVNP